ncbi:hypothetical protein GCM10023148_04960 [Actinokineospora soli]
MRISTAVVTGAASGIGLALSTRLSAGGAHVVMADVDREALTARAADLGATATPVVADLTDPVAVHALADTAFARLGHVDLLVNNAGVVGPVGVPVWEVDPEQVRRVLDVNFWSHLHVARAFVPRLLAQGRPAHIVQTASMSASVVSARSAA